MVMYKCNGNMQSTENIAQHRRYHVFDLIMLMAELLEPSTNI